jgi:hypothetical protein
MLFFHSLRCIYAATVSLSLLSNAIMLSLLLVRSYFPHRHKLNIIIVLQIVPVIQLSLLNISWVALHSKLDLF